MSTRIRQDASLCASINIKHLRCDKRNGRRQSESYIALWLYRPRERHVVAG